MLDGEVTAMTVDERCVMGSTLGDGYRCLSQAIPGNLWCRACLHSPPGPGCECEACTRPLDEEIIRGMRGVV